MSLLVFMIVGTSEPLYEADLGVQQHQQQKQQQEQQQVQSRSEDSAHLNQFIIHSSLDMVDRKQWTTSSTYLKTVDKFNDQLVSAMLTPGGVKLLLLHEGRSDEAVKIFFNEVQELYVKLLMNPFYEYDTPIISPTFDLRVRGLARRML